MGGLVGQAVAPVLVLVLVAVTLCECVHVCWAQVVIVTQCAVFVHTDHCAVCRSGSRVCNNG